MLTRTKRQTSKLFRALAAGAFGVALLSAPLVSTAQAHSNDRGHKHGHWMKYEKHWGHGHGRHHQYRHKHWRKKQVQKHRRLRHKYAHRYGHHHRHKPARKVVHIHKYPKHDRRDVVYQRELIGSIVEALLRAQAGHYR